MGIPNQVVPPFPLHPIPAIGEPFEHFIIDCVGPLPRTKTGNQYMLTVMCVSTRFPEAIPLRKITAPAITRALTKFFATFGLPRVVQSDQGSNFLSKTFKQALQTLGVSHAVSSAYHHGSQGALEHWHQTLKSMLKKYCFDTGHGWDEGVPFVLFAIRDAKQESLGFSPAELVFGHKMRGPLRKDQTQDIKNTNCSLISLFVLKLTYNGAKTPGIGKCVYPINRWRSSLFSKKCRGIYESNGMTQDTSDRESAHIRRYRLVIGLPRCHSNTIATSHWLNL